MSLDLIEIAEYFVHGKISEQQFIKMYKLRDNILLFEAFRGMLYEGKIGIAVLWEGDEKDLLSKVKLYLKEIYNDPESAIYVIEPDGTRKIYYITKPDDLSYLD